MSQETKNKNEQPKDEAVSEQVSEKELPAEEPKENAENPQEAKAEEAKKEEKPSELDTVKEQLAKEHDGYLRLAAEYDNFRKRSQKERDSTYQDAQISTIALFLPVLDNLERAASAAEADEGVRMILKQFQELLKKCGVEECGKEGEAFDPNFHNAVMHQEGEGTGEPVIVQVLQKGYTLNGRLIRPAMVKTTD